MREKFSVRKILIEALLIVLSVLFALFINEWKNNQNEKKDTEKIVNNLIAEITNNKNLVDSLIPYHISVLEKVQLVALNDSLETTFLKNGYFELGSVAPKGIKQGDLQSIAWSIAKEERISNRITLNESRMLFSIYEQQSRVLRTIERIIDILGSREIHRKDLLEESIVILALEWNEMISQEQQLGYMYSTTLDKMKKR